MFKNNCKCGATKFYLQYRGNMVGKYCSGCNKWQRWVGKKDLEVYNRNGYIVFKEDKASTSNSQANSAITSFKPCTKCGSEKFYLRYKGEMVGKYCEHCDKWSSWIGRKVLEELRYRGYKVNEESYVNPNIGFVEDSKKDVVSEVNGCAKCGSTDFYVKERGNNIGKYCSGCNKWLKWISKSEVKILQSQGIKVQSETYLSHHNCGYGDNNGVVSDSSRYVDHSDVYVNEYNKNNKINGSLGIDNGNFNNDININNLNTNNVANDLNINKKESNIVKNDVTTSKNDIIISNFKYTLEQNEANMFLLEKFIANTPRDCYGCSLESKCDMMIVKLCDSIKDAIDFIEDSEVF